LISSHWLRYRKSCFLLIGTNSHWAWGRSRIRGLGIAGASGLLSVLFPEYFGTVDQFVVMSLLCINGLKERKSLWNRKKVLGNKKMINRSQHYVRLDKILLMKL
jgi:hypothetical protein